MPSLDKRPRWVHHVNTHLPEEGCRLTEVLEVRLRRTDGAPIVRNVIFGRLNMTSNPRAGLWVSP